MEINKDNNNPQPEKRTVNSARQGQASPGARAPQRVGESDASNTVGQKPLRAMPESARVLPDRGNPPPRPQTRTVGQNGAAPSVQNPPPGGRTVNSAVKRPVGARPVPGQNPNVQATGVSGRQIPNRQPDSSAPQRPAPVRQNPTVRQAPAAQNPQGTPPQSGAARPVAQNPQGTSPQAGAAEARPISQPPQGSLLRADRTAVKSSVEDVTPPDKTRASVLRPAATITTDTRVIPAQGRTEKAPEAKPKKQKKESPMRERLREEGNNAVMSLVKAAIYLVCVLLVSTIISVTVIMVGNDMFAFVKSDDPINVVIPEDTDLGQISEILAENGIIKYPSIFKWYAEDKDAEYGTYAGIFVSGTHELRASMDYEDLLAALKPKRPSGTSWITFPEGFTTDEVIDLLVESGIGTIDINEKDPLYDYYSQYSDLREAYEGVINDYDFNYWFVDELEENGYSEDRFYRLDGYLFPDTYEFYNASKPHVVIDKMLARFSQIFTEEYRSLCEQSGYTVDEMIILASMVEKEAANAADYFNVSDVFHNRLENPAAQNTYTLDSDATVLYHIHHTTGERPTKTTNADTKMEVPYNTYLNKGLPPGAISNPSATAILAALNPSGDGYYFFVTGNLDTYFSVTMGQHETWIWRITNGEA